MHSVPIQILTRNAHKTAGTPDCVPRAPCMTTRHMTYDEVSFLPGRWHHSDRLQPIAWKAGVWNGIRGRGGRGMLPPHNYVEGIALVVSLSRTINTPRSEWLQEQLYFNSGNCPTCKCYNVIFFNFATLNVQCKWMYTTMFKSLAHVRLIIYSLFYFFKWLLLLSKAELIWSKVTNITIAVNTFLL